MKSQDVHQTGDRKGWLTAQSLREMLGIAIALGALIAILGACVSCVASRATPDEPPQSDVCHRTFYVSPDFPATEQAALQRAVNRWNAVAIVQFCLAPATTPAETTEHGIYRIVYRSPYWYRLSESFGGGDILGVHWGGGDQIGIVDVLSPELFELVALHEFGHAHGLNHTQPPSIMAAYLGSAKDFTDIDMAECVRVGACEADGVRLVPPGPGYTNQVLYR